MPQIRNLDLFKFFIIKNKTVFGIFEAKSITLFSQIIEVELMG